MAAILKIVSCFLLPNGKSDLVETYWTATSRFRIAKMVPS